MTVRSCAFGLSSTAKGLHQNIFIENEILSLDIILKLIFFPLAIRYGHFVLCEFLSGFTTRRITLHIGYYYYYYYSYCIPSINCPYIYEIIYTHTTWSFSSTYIDRWIWWWRTKHAKWIQWKRAVATHWIVVFFFSSLLFIII